MVVKAVSLELDMIRMYIYFLFKKCIKVLDFMKIIFKKLYICIYIYIVLLDKSLFLISNVELEIMCYQFSP